MVVDGTAVEHREGEMGQVQQKGKLKTPFAARQLRSATPSSAATERAAGPKEEIADRIRVLVKQRGLTRGETAQLVGEPVTRIALLLDGKLFSFTVARLAKMQARLERQG